MAAQATKSAKDRLILAVDTADAGQARQLIDELCDFVGVFKVGLELFCSSGPQFLESLCQEGIRVFFDGKFLDIPNTVAGASRAAASLGVFMFNVHATGGLRMMKEAGEAARQAALAKGHVPPKVIAVTILTSLGQDTLEKELGVSRKLEDHVLSLALMAREAGLDGVVCSANEVEQLRAACGSGFLLVTPGVRPSWASADDQVRIVTPAQAMRFGSDFVVVGRPITGAPDRKEAARRLLAEMDAALVS